MRGTGVTDTFAAFEHWEWWSLDSGGSKPAAQPAEELEAALDQRLSAGLPDGSVSTPATLVTFALEWAEEILASKPKK